MRAIKAVFLLGLAFGICSAANPQEQEKGKALQAEPELVVPAGTSLPIVLTVFLNSRSSQPGDSFYAETIYPIWVQQRQVMPRGSIIKGTVTQVERPGRVKGRGRIAFRFESVLLPNGVNRDLVAELQGIHGPGVEKIDRRTETVEMEGRRQGRADRRRSRWRGRARNGPPLARPGARPRARNAVRPRAEAAVALCLRRGGVYAAGTGQRVPQRHAKPSALRSRPRASPVFSGTRLSWPLGIPLAVVRLRAISNSIFSHRDKAFSVPPCAETVVKRRHTDRPRKKRIRVFREIRGKSACPRFPPKTNGLPWGQNPG